MSDSLLVQELQHRPRALRGRPVGTGIDDAERLSRIRALMNADPAMKPTTAIRAIGITDQSAIRRLRDKLKTASRPVPSARLRQPSPAPRAVACPAARNDNEFKRSEAPREAPPSAAPAFAASMQNDAVVACLDTFIRAMSAAFEAQKALAELMFTNPAVRMALSQYVSASQMALSMTPVPSFYRRLP